MVLPSRPVERLPIYRTASIGARVGPEATRMWRPAKGGRALVSIVCMLWGLWGIVYLFLNSFSQQFDQPLDLIEALLYVLCGQLGRNNERIAFRYIEAGDSLTESAVWLCRCPAFQRLVQ